MEEKAKDSRNPDGDAKCLWKYCASVCVAACVCGGPAKSTAGPKKAGGGANARKTEGKGVKNECESRERENDRPGGGEIIVSLHLVPITISCV